MTPSKFLPSHASFESLRKQAKKVGRQYAAGDLEALARVHAQLPSPTLPLSLRDAQLVWEGAIFGPARRECCNCFRARAFCRGGSIF